MERIMSNIKKLLDVLVKVNGDAMILKTGEAPIVKRGGETGTPLKKIFKDEDIKIISREFNDIYKSEGLLSYAGRKFLIKESSDGFEIVMLSISEESGEGFSATDGETRIMSTGSTHDRKTSLTITIDELLLLMKQKGASDLHLSSGSTPVLRIDGDIQILDDHPALYEECLMSELKKITPEKNMSEFMEKSDTDFAYELKGVGRFRTNIFKDLRGTGAVFRFIPSKILTVDDLGVPEAFVDLCKIPKGLILVTGPTGSGKSTTLAALIDHINKNEKKHIITVEDPIEFVYENQKSLINQREISTHTKSFKAALRATLREDPDIILVGEMRDLETISIAIEMAVTGHLVFGTLHTSTAIATVDRIIDQFPADRQAQIRAMLADSLTGVCSQTLLKKKGGGRVGAFEILIGTIGVRNLIREGKTFQMGTMMQTGRGLGMQMLNSVLTTLVEDGVVEAEESLSKAIDKENLRTLLGSKNLLIEKEETENYDTKLNVA